MSGWVSRTWWRSQFRGVCVALTATMLTAACGGGGGGGSDPPVPSPPNQPPVIGGTPATGVIVGQPYSFQPTASDPEGRPLTFTIANKPSWAVLDAASGRLSGVPATTDVGTFGGILISVSDGTLSASLPAFSIVVTAPSASRAELQWVAPTQNEDGSPLTNLAGFIVRYGQSATELTRRLDIPNPSATGVVIQELTTGTWYFTVAAYTTTFMESVQTDPVSKTIT